MRWYEPEIGDSRVTRKFLFIPRCFNGEYRWLEFCYIKEVYQLGTRDYRTSGYKNWFEIGFAPEKEKKDTEGFL